MHFEVWNRNLGLTMIIWMEIIILSAHYLQLLQLELGVVHSYIDRKIKPRLILHVLLLINVT